MTIAEIKSIMTDTFIADATVKSRYDLVEGKTFDEQFSKVSIENILFYAVATAIWFCYKLFDQHKLDIQTTLKENRVHTPQWFAARAKEFQFGHELIPHSDQYDNSQLTDDQIEAARVIRFSAAVEASDQSILLLKIATEKDGKKEPVSAPVLTAFKIYINTIKDAGVRVSIINAPADDLRLVLDIYYNPLLLDGDGKRIDGSAATPIQDVIRDYISNLAFNGFYANQSLVDKLQNVPGVEIAELKEASSRYGNYAQFSPINARSRPYAGHYQITDDNLTLNFISNE